MIFKAWLKDGGNDVFPLTVHYPDADFSSMKRLDFLVGQVCSVYVSASPTYISTPMCRENKLRLCIRLTNSHGWSDASVDVCLMEVKA